MSASELSRRRIVTTAPNTGAGAEEDPEAEVEDVGNAEEDPEAEVEDVGNGDTEPEELGSGSEKDIQ